MGAGKSTLVRGLAERCGSLPLEERFEENPYLAAFYREPSRWAFKSYVFFLQQTLEDYQRAASSAQGSVQERVLEEHLTVFGEEFHARGYLSGDDLALLARLTTLAAALVPRPDLLVYVRVDPAEALSRLRRRASPAEGEIQLDYLESLNERYKGLLAGWEGQLLCLDSMSCDFRQPESVAQVAETIRDSLELGS